MTRIMTSISDTEDLLEFAMGWSQDGIWSIGIPFTKHNIVREAYGKPKR